MKPEKPQIQAAGFGAKILASNPADFVFLKTLDVNKFLLGGKF